MQKEEEQMRRSLGGGEGATIPIWDIDMERDGQKQALWGLFWEGAWELMIQAIEKMPPLLQRKWKKELLGQEGIEKLSVWQRYGLGQITMEETLEKGKKVLVEINKGKYATPYTETDSQIEMLMNLGKVLSASQVETDYWGAVVNCLNALRSELPWNRTGFNNVTMRSLPATHVCVAVEMMKEVGEKLGIELQTIPDDWRQKINKLGGEQFKSVREKEETSAG